MRLQCGTAKVVSVSTLFRDSRRVTCLHANLCLGRTTVSVSDPTNDDPERARQQRPSASISYLPTKSIEPPSPIPVSGQTPGGRFAGRVLEGVQKLGVGPAVSIRTLLPGDFYLLFPDLGTLGFVIANGEANIRFDLTGEHAHQIRSIDDARCIERFNGKDLSFQTGGRVAHGPEPLKVGSLFVSKGKTRHFLAIQLSGPQSLLYVDLQEWKLTDSLPNAIFDMYNNWKFVRAWDGMVVYEFY